MEPHSRRAFVHTKAEHRLRVTILDPAWRRFVPRVSALVARAARVADVRAQIVLAGDRLVQDLNHRHRGQNKPTNILTYDSPAPELILALGTIRREAAASGRRIAHHLAHLVVHGALHLRGHDHDRPGDARRMEMEESRLLHRLRVPNPWKQAQGTGP